MKKRIMAGIMAAMMVLTMMQTTAFAESEETNKSSTETDSVTGKSNASLDIEDEEQMTTEESSEMVSEVSEEALSGK